MRSEQLDEASAVLARYPVDGSELLEVLAAQLGVEPAALQRGALADRRFEVVCRPFGLAHWERVWRDGYGRVHYGMSGTSPPETVFLRLRRGSG